MLFTTDSAHIQQRIVRRAAGQTRSTRRVPRRSIDVGKRSLCHSSTHKASSNGQQCWCCGVPSLCPIWGPGALDGWGRSSSRSRRRERSSSAAAHQERQQRQSIRGRNQPGDKTARGSHIRRPVWWCRERGRGSCGRRAAGCARALWGSGTAPALERGGGQRLERHAVASGRACHLAWHLAAAVPQGVGFGLGWIAHDACSMHVIAFVWRPMQAPCALFARATYKLMLHANACTPFVHAGQRRSVVQGPERSSPKAGRAHAGACESGGARLPAELNCTLPHVARCMDQPPPACT